ncbi:unnamed protein product [marine sediment metagenome]|uniref:Bacterial type II secretion system protein E domain-containing protein n=1 Tax=marine sediment metagenome TaxID=412755 RepID=X1MFD2_9ZZZZ
MYYPTYLKKLLEIAIHKGASDLHISCGHPPVLRITGALIDLEGEEMITPRDSQGLAFTLMTPEQREKFLKEKETDFAYNLEGKARFRVNVYFQRGNVSIALTTSKFLPPKPNSAKDFRPFFQVVLPVDFTTPAKRIRTIICGCRGSRVDGSRKLNA